LTPAPAGLFGLKQSWAKAGAELRTEKATAAPAPTMIRLRFKVTPLVVFAAGARAAGVLHPLRSSARPRARRVALPASAELSANLACREHGRVDVDVVVARVLADLLDQRRVGLHAAGQAVHRLHEVHDHRAVRP